MAVGTNTRIHPLGPLVWYRRVPASIGTVLKSAVILAGLLVPLVLAATLEPDARGYGTHEQLGWPPCGVLAWTGRPCPTCGMTTAFSLTVRGRWLSAIRAQPFGWLLAVALMLGVFLAAFSMVRPGVWVINGFRVPPQLVGWTVLILLIGSWAYKIATVSRLAGAAG